MYWLVAIAASTLIAAIVRFASRKIISDEKRLVFIDEFVGQAWSSVFIMELGMIGKEFGAPSIVLGLLVFVHFVLRNMYMSYANDLYDNPVAFLGAYYAEGRKVSASPFKIMGVYATQILALLAGQSFAKFVWQFGDKAHIDAITAECSTALSSAHSWQHAAFLEGFGVFILVLVGLVTSQTNAQVIALSATATALVTVFGYASGLFMNASIATAFSYRCNGHPDEWKFFMVYWIAPYLGMSAAQELWLGADKLKGMVQGKKDD